MAHYARVVPTSTENKFTVDLVIVADADFIATQPGQWVQTSYNTKGNVHYNPEGQPDGGVALRGNYAGLGYVYDGANDVFYAQQPYPSWSLRVETWTWEAPVPYPADGKLYIWDEPTQSWTEMIRP